MDIISNKVRYSQGCENNLYLNKLEFNSWDIKLKLELITGGSSGNMQISVFDKDDKVNTKYV